MNNSNISMIKRSVSMFADCITIAVLFGGLYYSVKCFKAILWSTGALLVILCTSLWCEKERFLLEIGHTAEDQARKWGAPLLLMPSALTRQYDPTVSAVSVKRKRTQIWVNISVLLQILKSILKNKRHRVTVKEVFERSRRQVCLKGRLGLECKESLGYINGFRDFYSKWMDAYLCHSNTDDESFNDGLEIGMIWALSLQLEAVPLNYRH